MDMHSKREMRKNKKMNEDTKSLPSTSINWFPGHMAKTRRQITEDLKLVDVIVEILDARIPISSQNPEIQEITDNLKKLINNNRYDIMLYIRPYKNLEKEKLSKALEILINQIDDIQLNDKYTRMLEINKAILWLNSSVNIELVLAKIAKALGR